MRQSGTLGYCHVRKEDLHSGSAREVDPPFASFDVVVRRDYDEAVAERDALREAIEAHREKMGGSVATPQARAVWAKASTRLWEALECSEGKERMDDGVFV